MKPMILGLFGITLAAAMAELILPAREGRGAKRALRFLTALAVLLVVAAPLTTLLRGEVDLSLAGLAGEEDAALRETYTALFEEAVAEGSAALLAKGIADFLKTEFKIEENHAMVRVFLDTEGNLQRVAVTLSGSALLKNPDEIQRALAEKLACEVEVR